MYREADNGTADGPGVCRMLLWEQSSLDLEPSSCAWELEDRVSLQLSVCNDPFTLCACLGERMVGRRSLLLRNFPGWLRGYPGKLCKPLTYWRQLFPAGLVLGSSVSGSHSGSRRLKIRNTKTWAGPYGWLRVRELYSMPGSAAYCLWDLSICL